MYAGGLSYDADNHAVYFTGATYKNDKDEDDGDHQTSTTSKCILGKWALQDHSSHVVTLGQTVDTPEACSALSLSANTQQAYMVGDTSTAGGLMTDDTNATQFGFVAQATIQEGDKEFQRTGGRYLLKKHPDAVTYPVAVVTIPVSSTDYVFVASMFSTVASETADAALIDKAEFPDLTSGGYRRYGSKYHLRLTKLKTLGGYDPGSSVSRETLIVSSDGTYQTDDDSSVYTTGMASVGQELVLVGSTRGSGGIFAQRQQGEDRTDMDGFIAKFDSTTNGSHLSTYRINSANNKDDWILQVCTAPNDSSVVYVVGATMGYDEKKQLSITDRG
jgi:hypothetical protein